MAEMMVWEGARNFGDLGGLALRTGGMTRYGIVYRSGASESITTQGWIEAHKAGLSLIVDLRNPQERATGHPDVLKDLTEIEVTSLPTEDPDDPAFLAACGPWLDHPRSWSPNMEMYPEKFAAIFNAIARTPGSVLVHCAGGRDRTGMVCSLLLTLCGATPEAIIANYEAGFRGAAAHRGHTQSYDPDADRWVSTPEHEWSAAELDAALDDRRPALDEWIRSTDAAGYLAETGVDRRDVDRIRQLLRP